MAVEQTNDKHTGDRRTTLPGNKDDFFKKHKILVIAGGAAGLVLLLSMKGNKGSSGSSASDQLSAYEQGVQDASNIAGAGGGGFGAPGTNGSSGIGGGGDTPTGSGSSTGTGSGDGSSSGSGSSPGGSPSGSDNYGQGFADAVTALEPLIGSGANAGTTSPTININVPKSTTRSNTKNTPHKAGTPAKVNKNKPRDKIKSTTPHKTKPEPANKNRAGHPNTRKVTHKGHKKKSPVQFANPDTYGQGITVHGRDFPGAISYRTTNYRQSPDGVLMADVLVMYGGRAETHTSCNNGEYWLDNTPGKNPLMNRPTPQLAYANEY